MASDRQIAANRRNAGRSTGPRSHGGKKRAARNAYRHGLSVGISSNPAFAKRLEDFAREIADDGIGAISLHRARAVAEAELDIGRARLTRLYSSNACARLVLLNARESSKLSPRSVSSLLDFSAAARSSPSASIPHPRCHQKSPIECSRPCGALCQNCLNWIQMSAARLRDATVQCESFCNHKL